jgi:hypothetical protein
MSREALRKPVQAQAGRPAAQSILKATTSLAPNGYDKAWMMTRLAQVPALWSTFILKHFQQKWEPVLRRIMRKNK